MGSRTQVTFLVAALAKGEHEIEGRTQVKSEGMVREVESRLARFSDVCVGSSRLLGAGQGEGPRPCWLPKDPVCPHRVARELLLAHGAFLA